MMIWADGKMMEVRVIDKINKLGEIEQEMVSRFVDRIAYGQRRYGAFTLHDNRDMTRELGEEILDAQIYSMRRILTLDNADTVIKFEGEGEDMDYKIMMETLDELRADNGRLRSKLREKIGLLDRLINRFEEMSDRQTDIANELSAHDNRPF